MFQVQRTHNWMLKLFIRTRQNVHLECPSPVHRACEEENGPSCLPHSSICEPVRLYQTSNFDLRRLADRSSHLRCGWTACRSSPAVKTSIITLERIETTQRMIQLSNNDCTITMRVTMRVPPHLHHCSRGLFCHIVNSILISQPIRSLHCVIKVPAPVVLLHVAQCSINPTL